MKEKEEQRYGRNKNTVVDKSYLESGEFRRKFDKISDDPELNRLLFKLAKKMLIHRSGTKFEDMYWIDSDLVEVIASECDCDVAEHVIYSAKTKKVIKGRSNLITIHSHPCSAPPSVRDLNSNYLNGYRLGIVVTHDGRVFTYNSFEAISEQYFSLKVAAYIEEGYNEIEAQVETLKYCQEHFDIEYKEVDSND